MHTVDCEEKKKRIVGGLRYFAFLNLGILLMTVGIFFFKAPNGFATGGVSGLSIILARLLPTFSQATYMLFINLTLLIVGVIVLGRECGGLTIYCSLMMSLENRLFECLIPLSEPLTHYPLLELIYAVVLTGVGSAIIFKCKASSGGTDIVALILKRNTCMNVATALLCTDLLIACCSFLEFLDTGVGINFEVGLFSIMGLFAKVFIVDDIIDSINMCKSFTIITREADLIINYITENMHHSATVVDGKGAFSGDERTIIMTVCKRGEAIRLRKRVYEIDPHSFIIITKTSEILGKGFRDNVQ